MKHKNILGNTYGRLFVFEFAGTDGNRHAFWMCKCVCGNIKKISSNHLLRKDYPVRSCGCSMHNKRLEGNLPAINNLYSSYRYNATDRGYKFDLSKEDFISITSSDCYYCGEPPKMIQSAKGRDEEYIYNGIDRTDNSLGYSMSNCVPCCKRCNRAKNEMSYEEFLDWIKDVYEKFYPSEDVLNEFPFIIHE